MGAFEVVFIIGIFGFALCWSLTLEWCKDFCDEQVKREKEERRRAEAGIPKMMRMVRIEDVPLSDIMVFKSAT
eukprot:3200303-Rhodomonas_salina.1